MLALYREVLEQATQEAGGEVVDREGDGMFLVFPTASGALRAVARSQARLREQPWPQGTTVRARIGVHAGEGDAGARTRSANAEL